MDHVKWQTIVFGKIVQKVCDRLHLGSLKKKKQIILSLFRVRVCEPALPSPASPSDPAAFVVVRQKCSCVLYLQIFQGSKPSMYYLSQVGSRPIFCCYDESNAQFCFDLDRIKHAAFDLKSWSVSNLSNLFLVQLLHDFIFVDDSNKIRSMLN